MPVSPVWYKCTPAFASDAQHWNGIDLNKVSQLFLGEANIGTAIDINTDFQIRDNRLFLANPANTAAYQINTSAITGNFVLSIPLITSNDSLVTNNATAVLKNKTIDVNDGNTISNIPEAALPEGLVKVDQANTYGQFLQKFQSGYFIIRNPANTFSHVINGSAITADRVLTIPLLTANDEFVMKNTYAEIENKLLDAGNTTSEVQTYDFYLMPNSGKRCGVANGGHTAPFGEGALQSMTFTAPGGTTVSIDGGSGVRTNFSTGTTANTNAGWRTQSGFIRSEHDPRLTYRVRLNNVTDSRFYFGFTNFSTAIPATDTPLGTTDSGVLLGFRSTDANYMLFRNDGTGAAPSAIDTLMAKPTFTNTLHIWSTSAGSTWNWATDSTSGTVTTRIPTNDTTLNIQAMASNTTTTAKDQSLKYVSYETIAYF